MANHDAKELLMNMQHSPVLAAVVAKQRQQELRREAQREHVARMAASANTANTGWPWTQLRRVAACMQAGSAHRLSEVTRRLEFRLVTR
jgi:hypothetical protein